MLYEVSTHSIRYRILKVFSGIRRQRRQQVSTHSIRYRILKDAGRRGRRLWIVRFQPIRSDTGY